MVLAVARKDLLIEWRARVFINQILPFVLVVLILFAFAFGTNIGLLSTVSPGLFWIAAFFAAQLAVGRAIALESENGVADSLLVMGVSPRALFLGKALAVVIELLVLEVVLGFGIAVLFNTPLHSAGVLLGVTVLTDIGVVSVGLVLAAISRGPRGGESLLPLLLFPIVAPVLLSATKAWEYGLQSHLGDFVPWLELIVAFSLVYLIIGLLVFGTVLEE